MLHIGYVPDTHGGPYEQPEPGPEASARFAEDVLAECEEAERQGFDLIALPERHARSECMLPDPMTFLAAVAVRTRRIKLATGVLMPALYEPIHLAEQAAAVDFMSRGRLIFGVGVGYHQGYFAHFGVPFKQREGRFVEGMELIRKAWTTEGPFSHHGKYFHYDAIHLTPKPFQRPTPPIWVGAFAPKSIARAGQMGDGYTMAPFLESPEELRPMVDAYREAAARAGRKPYVVLLRDGWLASSMAEAERVFAQRWLGECRFYLKYGMIKWTPEFRSEADFTVEKVRDRLILGTASDWLEQLERWRSALGIDCFTLRLRLPLGPEPARVRECIQRIGEEVLPKLRQA